MGYRKQLVAAGLGSRATDCGVLQWCREKLAFSLPRGVRTGPSVCLISGGTLVTEMPETRESLLLRLKDPCDREAWDQFADLYRPVVYRLARRRGLQDADAQDLSQQVLMAVASAIPRWQRSNEQTRFRHWLRRVAKNATLNALSRRTRDVGGGGSDFHHLLRETAERDQATEEAIDWEHRREIYRRAVERIRAEVSDSTWQIFARSTIDGESIRSVSESLGKSIGAIYVARCRTMNRLREAVDCIQRELDA